jgi:hypothetical protein
MADKGPDRLETLANVRSMYPAYQGMGDLELGNALAGKYPDAYGFLRQEVPSGEGDKVTRPSTPESTQAALLNPGQPKPLDMVQRFGNTVLPPLAAAPTIAAVGEVAPALGAAPAVGRAVASGLLGGAKAASTGENVPLAFLFDTLTAGAFEGAGALASRVKAPHMLGGGRSGGEVAEAVGTRRSAFDAATKSIDVAFDAISPRLPSGKWLYIPAISSKKLSTDEARAGFHGLEGKDFEAARKQLIAELQTLDKRAAKRLGQNLYTAQEAGTKMRPARFTPKESAGERLLADKLPAMRPGLQAGVDAEMSQDTIAPGIPTGVLPVKRGFEFLAEHMRPRL